MRQLEFKKTKGWGGKRRGAGRKNRTGTVSHAVRERVDFKKPLHITMRLMPGLKGLRTAKMKAAFERCLIRAKAKGLRVLHFSIQGNHLHFVIECASNTELASGMNSLGTSFGRTIRAKLGGKGGVFDGRYHLHVLKTPAEMRNALAYVLLNRSKHQDVIPYKDDFSSAEHFQEWKLLIGQSWRSRLPAFPDHLSRPKSWLARTGWKMARPV